MRRRRVVGAAGRRDGRAQAQRQRDEGVWQRQRQFPRREQHEERAADDEQRDDGFDARGREEASIALAAQVERQAGEHAEHRERDRDDGIEVAERGRD